MKKFIVNWLPILVLGVAILWKLHGRHVSPPPPSKVAWVAIADAPRLAATKKLPILYDFSAVWCGPCRELARDVFADDAAAAYINEHFIPAQSLTPEDEPVPVRDDERALATRFGVQGFPTLVIVPANGTHPQVANGYGGKSDVIAFLHDNAK